MNKKMYLTNTQYGEFLLHIMEHLNKNRIDLEYWYDDSIGNKHTKCGPGLYGDGHPDFAEKHPDVRMWPDRPGDFRFKYRRGHHRCPLDGRTQEFLDTKDSMFNGCFYTCQLHQEKAITKLPRMEMIKELKRLYAEQIATAKAKGWIKEN